MTLAERLRENADQMDDQDSDYNQSRPLLREAADTIDRLTATLKEIIKEYRAYGPAGIDVMYQIAADALPAKPGEGAKT